MQAEGHRYVGVGRSEVGGSIQLDQGGGARVTASRVTGDIQAFTNRGVQQFNDNRVNGNLSQPSRVLARQRQSTSERA